MYILNTEHNCFFVCFFVLSEHFHIKIHFISSRLNLHTDKYYKIDCQVYPGKHQSTKHTIIIAFCQIITSTKIFHKDNYKPLEIKYLSQVICKDKQLFYTTLVLF